MKRRRSKRVIRTKEEKEYLRQIARIQSLANTTNYRIKAIEKKLGDKNHYAVKSFLPRAGVLGVLTKKNYVSLSEKRYKKMTLFELKNVERLLKNFLNTDTSKLSKIKEIENNQRNMFKDEYFMSDSEIETINEMWENESINEIYKYIPPSELWAIIKEVNISEKKGSKKDKFLQIVKRYYDVTNNADFVNVLNKFINYHFK